LEAALGINMDMWMGLQAEYNQQKAQRDESFMQRIEKIRQA
jgi:antitoxin HigA-1